MLVEGVPLREAPAALLTLVRSRAGVDVGVVPQVFLGSEALAARLAHEGLLALIQTAQRSVRVEKES